MQAHALFPSGTFWAKCLQPLPPGNGPIWAPSQ